MPQQGYGAPQQGYGGAPTQGSQDFAPLLQTKLTQIITANNLQVISLHVTELRSEARHVSPCAHSDTTNFCHCPQPFYPPQALQAVLQRLATVDFRCCGPDPVDTITL